MKQYHKEDNNLAEYLFHEGTNYTAYNYLGAHFDGDVCIFRTWAPNAREVYVTGSFNNWDKYTHKAYRTTTGGIFECVVENVQEFDSYKYIIISENGEELYKADPYGYHSETRPGTASKVYNLDGSKWSDEEWMKNREAPYNKAVNIYEVHLGSWRRYSDGNMFSYDKIAEELIPYIKEMGFTHIELMPISEYPYDKSWGYQVTGYYAPTSRYGTPKDFMKFVDICHQNGIGVILDWVPAHFPKDSHGLFEFDGTSLYEYADPLKKEHKDWGTVVFDYSKGEVVSFLISSADFFFSTYHVDGIRMDAVASMLYLDYQRIEWRPNIGGGNYNLEAIDFIKNLNSYILSTYQGAMMIAEESTAFPMVTMPPDIGGLGFSYKWNMGWMNDNLSYLATDPIYRKSEHNKMTFSITYAFSENYILPLSHDEVVHGKYSLIGRSQGDYQQKFANLKTFLGFYMAHPGKKLSFMGNEFAQFIEWDYKKELDWFLLDYPAHKNMQDYVRELNLLYKKEKSFYQKDCEWSGFEWVVVEDRDQSVFAVERISDSGRRVLCIANFTPVDRYDYKIGVKNSGKYKVLLSSDDTRFGGRGLVQNIYDTQKIGMHGRSQCISLNLAGNSVTFLALTK